MSVWGQGAKNNNIGWGQGAANNNIGWGNSHKVSWAGDTEIVGTDGAAPVNTIAPVISGTATIGQTLTSTSGTWTSDTGITGYLYQWYRGATLITGAVSSTYVLTLSDVGFYITCRVAATDTDGTSAYVSSNSIFLFDADYQTVLNIANNLGYSIPTYGQQIVQNQLVLDLKAGGVWSELDVFYVFATGTGATNAFASLNWKAPALYQGTLTNPLTFATNVGFTNNSTGSISTNFIPSTQGVNYQKDDASRFAWVQNVGISFIDGIMSNSVNRMTFTGNPDTQNINNGTTSNAIGALSGVGLKSINRPASNQIRLFQNTTLSVSGTTTSTSSSSATQLIFRSSGGSTPTIANYGTHTISVYGMGASLVTSGGDATLNTNLYNAINTYMNNLI